jgi:hypothetical protein
MMTDGEAAVYREIAEAARVWLHSDLIFLWIREDKRHPLAGADEIYPFPSKPATRQFILQKLAEQFGPGAEAIGRDLPALRLH